ncbi:MAG: glycosyltransferase family 4 protein [Desulfobulbaceae bacterium]|nr:MAG: glycosyltransferase family 4 protein [Desulfobulbaceae bacterium]
MKIVYILTRSDTIGGASIHLLNLAAAIKSNGNDVLIFAGGDGIFFKYARQFGLECYPLRFLVREINPFKDIRCFFELKDKISTIKPDLIHLHSTKAGLLGRLVARNISIPSVFTVHGWAFTEGLPFVRRSIFRLIERLMAKFSDKIITVSKYDYNLAIDARVVVESSLEMIHNGIHDVCYSPNNSSTDNNVRIIMVARFEAPKCQIKLIQALAMVEQEDWTMEFVGDGPGMSVCKDEALSFGLEKRILFSGACDDVSQRLSNSDIFVLISDWEAFPLTILEAMRAGLPIIASQVGGIPEAVEHAVNGFLIPRGDTDTLVNAMRDLITSAEMRQNMGKRGREKFENEFIFNEMFKKTIKVYEMVVNKKS